MRLKKAYIIFATLFIFFDSFAFPSCDSIRFVGFNEYSNRIVALSRKRFLQIINNKTMEVDTTIVNKKDITSFEKCIKNLAIKEKLNYDAEEIIENKSLDNQILLILFYSNKKEYIWISMFYVDRRKYRYYINDEFKEFLSCYTDLFSDV